jgi:hypothetical protein
MNEPTSLTSGPADVTRLAAALEQTADDARAILAALDLAEHVLPEHAAAALRDRAADIVRHSAKALESEVAHRRDAAMRAQREDLTKRALVERIGQLDAARLVAATLAARELPTHFADATAEAAAWEAAERFARQLGYSSAAWAAARAKAAAPRPDDAPDAARRTPLAKPARTPLAKPAGGRPPKAKPAERLAAKRSTRQVRR